MLEIYVMDLGSAGNIMVIAESETEARELMKGQYNYDKDVGLTVLPLQKGLVWCNLGDL